jgi:GTP-binding protein EngB required for normal cell division
MKKTTTPFLRKDIETKASSGTFGFAAVMCSFGMVEIGLLWLLCLSLIDLTTSQNEDYQIQFVDPIETIDRVENDNCTSVCPEISPDDTKLAIITVGNSGVGKSFLTNILIGEEVFLHKYSPGSITRKLEFVVTNLNGFHATVYNLPGLIEGLKANIELNKREIEKAFLGKSKQLILFIFGVGDGGRLRHEDLVTYLAMSDAYEFHLYTLVFIINNIKPFYSHESQDNYQSMMIVHLKTLLNWPSSEPFHIVFAEDFSNESKYSLRIALFREELVETILRSASFRHEKKHEIELNSEKYLTAKQELSEVESQNMKLKQEYHDDIIKLKEQMEEQRVVNERKREELEHQLALMRLSGGKRKSQCFPGNSLIHVRNKGLISMELLRYGDEVQCVDASAAVGGAAGGGGAGGGGGKGITLRYCEVYFFGHLNPNILSYFINLRTTSNHTLRLSPTHFAKICIHGCHLPPSASPSVSSSSSSSSATEEGRLESNASFQMKSIYAADVKIGDLLLTVVNEQLTFSTVEEIWLSEERGLYNPYIRSHDLIVNGVIVSSHSEWILDQFSFIPRDALPSLYEMIFFPIYLTSLLLGPMNSYGLASFLGIHSHSDGFESFYFVTFFLICLLSLLFRCVNKATSSSHKSFTLFPSFFVE